MSRRLGIRIGFLIHDVSRLRRSLFDARSPHLDITGSEAWVLTGISRRPSGISQTELAKVLGLGKVATGEFVAGLEKKGFLVRRMDDIDRRAYRVQLTQRGRGVLAKISDVVAQMNAEIFENVSHAELDVFSHAQKDENQAERFDRGTRAAGGQVGSPDARSRCCFATQRTSGKTHGAARHITAR